MPTTVPAETRTVIENVRWETYVALVDDRQGSIPRMTYAQGRLELKLDLFAAMEIQEVWRHNGRSLQLFRLKDGQYESVTHSVALPGFPADVAELLLSQRLTQGETSLVRQFRNSLAAS